MAVYEMTFSPTGGTKRVAALVASAFGQARVPVDLTDGALRAGDFRFGADDVCIVAAPSYGGRVPAIAAAKLKRMAGGGAKAVLIAVYGNRAYEDTLAELHDVLTGAGFRCAAALAAVAEHSILRQFAAGRPDGEDARELFSHAEKIRRRIEAGSFSKALALPGKKPYREYHGAPIKPRAGSACVRCGLCAVKCPAGAILAADPAQTDAAKCISCMRCVAVCPNGARGVSEHLLADVARRMESAFAGRKQNELFL